MKDNEIIKALECCDNYFDCDGCPCEDVCGGLSNLTTNTLDLIKRLKRESNSYRNKAKGQKGELARLNKQVADLTEKLEALGDPLQDAQYKIAEQQAEIERLKEENKFHRKTIQENAQRALEVTIEEVENAKAEAVKELSTKLFHTLALYEQAFIENQDWSARNTTLAIINELDTLVKEMAGDIPKLEHNSLCETDTYEVGE